MDSVNSNLIANLASTMAIEKFGLDHRYSLAITTMVSSALISLKLEKIRALYDFGYTMHLVGVILIAGLVYWYMYRKKEKDERYISLRTYKYQDCSLIRFMMTKHPNFYDSEYDMVTGNPECRDLEEFFVPQEEVEVKFTDAIHNVKGYITMDFSEFTKEEGGGQNSKAVQKKAYYMTVYLLKGQGINCDQYMKKIEGYRKRCQKESNELNLYMVKVMGKSGEDGSRLNNYHHEVEIYDAPRDNWEDRYNKYMLSYFSPIRDRLWKYFHNIQFHPEKFSQFGQEARCNLLIHGPPGTGKSSFVYRLAMSLGRHIVSVDITAISNDRTQVYKVIQTPYIEEIDDYCQPKECIILLEEFDIAVHHLKDKSKPSVADLWSMGPKMKKKKSDDEKDDGSVLDLRSFARSTREFELEDLLEILQGPVPIKGQIIIATTNKYKEISELCPALFRPGRLTPVEFGYMDWDSLQQMTKHYFKQELTIDRVDEINVPTSEIVELALDSSLYDEKGFDRFQTGLQKIFV
jgi:hypothetical protein